MAGIVERGVPTAALAPFGPHDVIAIFAVGISSFPGRTIDALVDGAGDDVPGHRGCCQYRKNNGRSADQFEFRHAFLPLVPVTQVTWYQQVQFLASKRILNQV